MAEYVNGTTDILGGSVIRYALNTTTANQAVIRKIIAGNGITISSTGVDAGTGDVTISVDINGSGGGTGGGTGGGESTGIGTVTSVNMTVPEGLTVYGAPITTAGTIALRLSSGYTIPLYVDVQKGIDAYDNTIMSFSYNTSSGIITLTQRDGGSITTSITLDPFTTSDLAEGTNLYYTDARARLAISETITGIDYNSTTGVFSLTSGYIIPTTTQESNWTAAYNDKINSFGYNTSTGVLTLTQQDGGTLTATVTLQPFTTDNLTEGSTNLYFTQARARASVSAGTGISYNSSTGVITNSAPDQTVVLTAGAGISISGTYPSFTIASTITQYTDALARAAISETITGIDYNSSTGVFSLTAGYVIPTTTQASNWDTAYGWGNHAVAGYQLLSEKGQANGYASLDAGGKVPSSQLPSYVDDVLEYANLAAFPATGETGKIYVTLDTNKTYRWTGSAYVEIAQGNVGTVTQVSVVTANGFAGTVANNSSTPAITLTTTVTGILKGNGTAISAAVANTDYQSPITLTTTGSSGAATFNGTTLNIPNYSFTEADTLDSVTDRGEITTNKIEIGGIYATSARTTNLVSELNYFVHKRLSSSGVMGFKLNNSTADVSFWRWDDGTGDLEFGNMTNYGLSLFTNNVVVGKFFNSGNFFVGGTPVDNGYKVDIAGNLRTSGAVYAGYYAGIVNNCLYTYITNHCGSSGYIAFGFNNTTNPTSADTVFEIYQGLAAAPVASLFNFKHNLLNSLGNYDQAFIGVNGSINQSGSGTGTIRGFYYNPTLTNVVGTHYAWESTVGKFKISDLTGSGTRMVVADASGVLSTQSVPSFTDTNIYNSDGTLTGNRTVTSGGFTLTFNPKTFFDNGITYNASAGNVGTFINTHNYATNSTQLYFYPDSGTNVAQTLNIIPRGTGFNSVFKAQFSVYNNDVIANGMTNAEFVTFRAAGSLFTFASGAFGTGTIRPLMFSAGYATDSATNINQLYLATSGNVIVGGSTDAGYKLDVQGTGRFTGNLRTDSILYIGGTSIEFGNASGSRYFKTDLNPLSFKIGTQDEGYFGGGQFVYRNQVAVGSAVNAPIMWMRNSLTNAIPSSAGAEFFAVPQVNHQPTNLVIAIGDSAYGGGSSVSNLWLYPGKNTTTNAFGNIYLAHDGTNIRGSVGVGTNSISSGYILDSRGLSKFENTATYTAGAGVQAVYSNTNLTIESGASISSGSFIGALYSLGILTFNGNVTVPNSVIMSSQFLGQRVKLNSASMTVTMNQGSTGIRALSGQVQQVSFDDASTAGTVSHVAGIQFLAPYKFTGTQVNITNYYGIVINPSDEYSSQVSIANRWGLYQKGSADRNYFEGNVIIGSSNTNAGNYPLQVTGQVRFNSYTSGSSYSGTVAGYLAFDASGNLITVTSAGGGTLTAAITFNNGGSGAVSGSSFDGSSALTISYNTIGAVGGSGTTSYIPKWASGTSLSNSLMYDNGSGIGINTTSVSASAVLQADSITKGFLPPRMTLAQRTGISSPAEGLIVVQTDGTQGLYIYINATWRALTMV